jgi:hypothetical protein
MKKHNKMPDPPVDGENDGKPPIDDPTHPTPPADE